MERTDVVIASPKRTKAVNAAAAAVNSEDNPATLLRYSGMDIRNESPCPVFWTRCKDLCAHVAIRLMHNIPLAPCQFTATFEIQARPAFYDVDRPSEKGAQGKRCTGNDFEERV